MTPRELAAQWRRGAERLRQVPGDRLDEGFAEALESCADELEDLCTHNQGQVIQ